MPTSPIVFNAPDNTELMQTIGKGISNLYNRYDKNQQALKLAQDSDLGKMIGNTGASETSVPPGQPRSQSMQPTDQTTANQPIGQTETYFPNVSGATSAQPGESLRPIQPPTPLKPFSPQEEAQVRAALINKGVKDRDLQDNFIAKMKKYREEQYASAKESYEFGKDYRAEKEKENERFYTTSKPELDRQYPGMSPAQLSIWKNLARLSENAPNDESRLSQTNQAYEALIYEPLQEFDKKGPSLPIGSVFRPGDIKNSLSDAKSIVQDHLASIDGRKDIPESLKSEMKNYLRDKYSLMLKDKDWGVAQAAYAVSDLSDTFKKSIAAAPQPKETFTPISVVSGLTAPFTGMKLPERLETREKQVYELANSLANLQPNDSLILARDYAIDQNYTDEEFNKALEIAKSKGKLQFSEFQRGERPKLSVSQRLDLDSVMTGKRSVFDYFKAKK